MQLSKIKEGRFYQTKKGIGKCVHIGMRQLRMDIVEPAAAGVVYVDPKEVEHEIPKGNEPKREAGPNEGTLKKKDNGRWSIFHADGTELFEASCGSVMEVLVGGHWIKTSIEHSGKDYYATAQGVKLCEGLPARSV